MISKSSILCLFVLAFPSYAAPMHRADNPFIPRMTITIHNEDDTSLKVLSLHMAGGDFFDGNGDNDIRYVHLTVDQEVEIEMSLRVVKAFSTKHAHVTYNLVTVDGDFLQEAYTEYIHTFDAVCPEGGVGHEFMCEKGSGIKNLKLKLHNQWPNAEKFMQRELMLFVTIESAEKDTLLSTWVYAKLH